MSTPAPKKASAAPKPMSAKAAARLAKTQARIQADKEAMMAAKASGKRVSRPKSKPGAAWDFSPLLPPSTDGAAMEIENNAAFSASDTALFARAAGLGTTTIEASEGNEDEARDGEILLHNSCVSWGDCSGFYITIVTREGVDTDYLNYGGAYFRYKTGGPDNSDGDDDVLTTKVEIVPLVRNAAGVIETYRVDVYKTDYGANVPLAEGSTARAFAVERIALKILVTERVVGNKFLQTSIRVQQSADELAVVAYGATSDSSDNGAGSVRYEYNDNYEDTSRVYPLGTIQDVIDSGVVYAEGDDNIGASMGRIECGDPGHFSFSDGDEERLTTTGLVYHTRVPLSYFEVKVEQNTLGTPLPPWALALIIAAFVASLIAIASSQRRM